MMKRKLIYILLFVCGVTGGVFFSLNRAGATSPVGETSKGMSPTVIYDEIWSADSAIATRSVGAIEQWTVFTNFPSNPTPPSKKPKMVVTRWVVHGHIHFLQ